MELDKEVEALKIKSSEKHGDYLQELDIAHNSFLVFIVCIAVLFSLNTYQQMLSKDSLVQQMVDYFKSIYVWVLFKR